jgi:hypothetical protein
LLFVYLHQFGACCSRRPAAPHGKGHRLVATHAAAGHSKLAMSCWPHGFRGIARQPARGGVRPAAPVRQVKHTASHVRGSSSADLIRTSGRAVREYSSRCRRLPSLLSIGFGGCAWCTAARLIRRSKAASQRAHRAQCLTLAKGCRDGNSSARAVVLSPGWDDRPATVDFTTRRHPFQQVLPGPAG